MLTYDEALARIVEAVPGPLPAESVPLMQAAGRALAEDIVADVDLPPFDNSAVDGYAICGDISAKESPVTLPCHPAEIPAGGTTPPCLTPGYAVRIFTGAMVPPGADRIIMQEEVKTGADGTVTLETLGKPGQFIRRRGSDVVRDTRILTAGHTIEAGEIGLLAALNRVEIPCTRLPTVGILTTGDELVPVGAEPLAPGQIRDANGPALTAAVAGAGGKVAGQHHARDTQEAVRTALHHLMTCDVIIASGGVSVGGYDVVRAVLQEMGVLDFWRIAIKPGKPLAFGTIGNALFFGLPGNPVSSLVTFELFVRPVLRKLAGYRAITRRTITALLTIPLPHEPGRREFVRATLEWQENTWYATPTGAQGSHRLSSLLGADALLIAHEDHGDYEPGTRLPALLLVGT